MNTPEKPSVPGTVIWQRQDSLVRVKAMLYFMSGIVGAIAIEAIHVAIAAASSGITPLAFGIMPTRSLTSSDVLMVIVIGSLGLIYVGFNAVRMIVDGLPLALGQLAPDGQSGSGLAVAWDGLRKPIRTYQFADITEIDAVARGTIGSGGHQVRIRLKHKRVAVSIARFETSAEADQLVNRLVGERERALGQAGD